MEYFLWIGFYFMTFYALLPALVSRIFGFRVFARGRTDREIALTFDDGPDPVYTPQLLDLLKRYGAKGTFFLVGSHAEQWPDIVARIHEEGHVIGIHNYVHHSNWLMRPKTVRKQILRTSEIIKRITGARPVYYRPPWGIVNLFDYRRLGHLQIVLWTSIFGDWRVRVGAEKLYRRMRRKLKPGEVFVLHDCGRTFGADEDAPAQTIEALERILAEGREQGYRFVGIDEMIALTERNAKAGVSASQPSPAMSIASGGDPRMNPNEGREESAAPAKPVHKSGPAKKAAVALWMLWEKIFHVLFRLRPAGDGTSFNYRVRKYAGPTLPLRDGQSLRSGDYVMEMHFENKMLYEMGMNSRSSVHTAIRLVREVERGLPDLARALETDPNGDKVSALYGISIIHRGSEGLGFQVFDLPKGLFSWLTQLYLRFMLSVINPDGGKRLRENGERLTPRMLVMERSDLLAWKDRTGKQRPSRASKAAAPSSVPMPVDPAIGADQIGRTI
ncbi:polysaccharide deacetylase family protein [Cohnella sp. CFH 77786]|uniref:polysaccharide deacetylase family protein n=1 Tax=Cohnella sp. CFH 77786 TaxID=2662265 RepID=UPI001C60FA9A|nr:polysaccharide deacetylase family protein [Cohnella sp. CFH 77786]MBW5444982.1 polysaccharide deacetylase family protein [Cohnella sp. CFH 77786]